MENGECPFLHYIQLTLGENKEVELEQLLGSELFIQKEEETKKKSLQYWLGGKQELWEEIFRA